MSVPGGDQSLGGANFALGLDLSPMSEGFIEAQTVARAQSQAIAKTISDGLANFNGDPFVRSFARVQAEGRAQLQALSASVTREMRAMGATSGVTLRVRADTGTSAAELRRISLLTQDLRARGNVALRVTMEGNKVVQQAREIQAALRAAREGDTVSIEVIGNATQFERVMRKVEEDVNAANERGVNIPITANLQAAGAQARQADIAAARAAAGGNIRVSVNVDKDQADEDLAAIDRGIKQLQAKSAISFRIRADGGAETAKQVADLSAALTRAQRTDRVSVRFFGNAKEVQTQFNQSITEMRAAAARGVEIDMVLDTTQAEQRARLFQATIGGIGRGAIRGLGFGEGILFGAGAGLTAVAGIAAVEITSSIVGAMRQGTVAAVQYNTRMEQLQNTMTHFTGSSRAGAQAIAALNKVAEEAGRRPQEVQDIGAGFIRTTGGDVERMRELTELTLLLSSARPGQPIEEIGAAMRQLISGDFQAFEDRMNITFGTVRRLAAEGKSGMELFRAAVAATGASQELLAKQAGTTQAQFNVLQGRIDRLNASFGRGLFDVVREDLTSLNGALRENERGWNLIAEAAGRFLAQMARRNIITQGVGLIGQGLNAVAGDVQRLFPEQAAQTEVPAGPDRTQRAAQFRAVSDEIDKASGRINVQKGELQQVQNQLAQNAAAAGAVTAKFEEQLRPIELELQLLQRVPAGIQQIQIAAARARGLQAEATLKREQSLGDPGVRAEIAGAQVRINHEREILEIRQRRAEITESITQAELSMSQRAAQHELSIQERSIDGLRKESEARQRTRQDQIQDLRDEIEERQYIRELALQSAREEAQAQSETRQIVLEGLREEIDLRRQNYDDARDAEQERGRIAAEGYDDRRRSADEAHRVIMQGYQDEIQALRDQENQAKRIGETRAETALRELQIGERIFELKKSVADAERRVAEATTLKSQRDALLATREARRELDVGLRQINLQERIRKEKEADERNRANNQREIAALERKARDEDRAYQDQRRIQEEAERQRQRTFDEAQRQAERQEKQTQRTEDARVRELEKADKAEDRRVAAEIRDLEKADREASRTEARQIRDEERAFQAEQRADQERIAALLEGIAAQRAGLEDSNFAAAQAADAARIERLKESAALEQRMLDLRERSANVVNVDQAAMAAAMGVIADSMATISGARLQIDQAATDIVGIRLAGQAETIRLQLALAVAPLRAFQGELEQREREIRAKIEEDEARVRALNQQRELLRSGGQAAPGTGLIDESIPPGFKFVGAGDGGVGGALSDALLPKSGELVVVGIGRRLAELAGGWAANISSTFSARLREHEADTGASMIQFISNGIIGPAESDQGLQIASPSRRSGYWADELVNGFINRLAERQAEVAAAIVALFPVGEQAGAIGTALDAFMASVTLKLLELGPVYVASPDVQAGVQTGFATLFPYGGDAGWAGTQLDQFMAGVSEKLVQLGPTYVASEPVLSGIQVGFATLFPYGAGAGWAGTQLDQFMLGIGEKLEQLGPTYVGSAAVIQGVQTGFEAVFPYGANAGWAGIQLDNFMLGIGQKLASDMGPAVSGPDVIKGVQDGFAILFPVGTGAGDWVGQVLDAFLLSLQNKLVVELPRTLGDERLQQAVRNGISQWFSDSNLGPMFMPIYENFKVYGANSANSFMTGYYNQMTQFQPAAGTGGAAQSGGGSAGTATTSGGGSATYSNFQWYGTEDINRYLTSAPYNMDPYSSTYRDWFDYYIQLRNDKIPAPSDMIVTGRQFGGPLDPFQRYRVSEGGDPEIIMGSRGGYAQPMRDWMRDSGAGGRGVNVAVGDIVINLQSSSENPRELAREIVTNVKTQLYAELESAVHSIAEPVDRVLPGA